MVIFHCPLEQRTCTSVYVKSIRRAFSLTLTREKALMKIYSANITIRASMQITTMATAKKIKSRFE